MKNVKTNDSHELGLEAVVGPLSTINYSAGENKVGRYAFNGQPLDEEALPQGYQLENGVLKVNVNEDGTAIPVEEARKLYLGAQYNDILARERIEEESRIASGVVGELSVIVDRALSAKINSMVPAIKEAGGAVVSNDGGVVMCFDPKRLAVDVDIKDKAMDVADEIYGNGRRDNPIAMAGAYAAIGKDLATKFAQVAGSVSGSAKEEVARAQRLAEQIEQMARSGDKAAYDGLTELADSLDHLANTLPAVSKGLPALSLYIGNGVEAAETETPRLTGSGQEGKVYGGIRRAVEDIVIGPSDTGIDSVIEQAVKESHSGLVEKQLEFVRAVRKVDEEEAHGYELSVYKASMLASLAGTARKAAEGLRDTSKAAAERTITNVADAAGYTGKILTEKADEDPVKLAREIRALTGLTRKGMAAGKKLGEIAERADAALADAEQKEGQQKSE